MGKIQEDPAELPEVMSNSYSTTAGCHSAVLNSQP